MKQKLKLIIALFLIPIFLLSCVSKAAVPAPTATAAPTITPTPVPQSLADAPDLSTWVEDYVHAYGGTVTVNGVEMDAGQLTVAIQQNPDVYLQQRYVNGEDYQFAVVNEIPLAMMKPDKGDWQRVFLRDIVEIPGGIEYIGAEPRISGNFNKDFNQGTAGVYWFIIEPERGVYDFTNFDTEVKYLKEHGMLLRGHALVFPTSLWNMPDWLLNGNFSKEELEQIMVDHITTVIKHGKELGVTEWVVVNEPYIPSDRENDVFYSSFGGYGYIDIAFAAARKADPEALLIYNDVDNHSKDGYLTSLTKEIVTRLRTVTVTGEDGIERPVLDAVGIQGHLGDWAGVPDVTDVITTLKSYDLPVIVTEFDYSLKNVEGTDIERYSKQAEVYSNFLSAATAAGCQEFTFWSYSDANNWQIDVGNPDAAPALYDRSEKPKPAYYGVLKVLYEQLP